jgi:GWxTD domain-containing protein
VIASVCVRRLSGAFLAFFICISAAGSTSPQSPAPALKATQEDPLARPKKQQKPVAKTETAYKKWLDEDVKDIITPEEESAFRKLTNDSERQNFVEAFWRRRDPTPDTEENEFKEEHYRRLAYANEHFSAGVAGSKTDRGRIYIIHGPPDSIETHPAGGPYQRPAEEGGGETNTFPFEIWRYRNIDGIGQEIEIEFVDSCGCGAYHLAYDPGEKDADAHIPNAGLTTREALGLDSKANRGRNGFNTLGASLFGSNQSRNFDRMQTLVAMTAPPPIQFRDLKAIVDVKMRYNLLPFDVRIDFVRQSVETALVPVTIQVANRDLTYVSKDGAQHASVNIFGRVSTLGGQIVSTFEDPLRLDVPAELMESFAGNVSLYQQALPLHPGRYRLDLVIKDVNSDKLGTLYQSITVPDFSNDEKLNTSSLVLADLIEPVAARNIGAGPFVLGAYRVRPRVPKSNGDPVVIKRGQKLAFWMQVYNLALPPNGKNSSARIDYRITLAGADSPVLELAETTDQMKNPGGQITLEKSLSTENMAPGTYEIAIVIRDRVSEQSTRTKARFVIE